MRRSGVYLISPFVGQILDLHKTSGERQTFTPDEDPSVVSVTIIYRYHKEHGDNPVVMGASFRNSGKILALAGYDR